MSSYILLETTYLFHAEIHIPEKYPKILKVKNFSRNQEKRGRENDGEEKC